MSLTPLPCPFCGHVGLGFQVGSTYSLGVAYCMGCGATAGEVESNYPDDGAWHEEAIAAWNRRTYADHIAADEALLGQALEALNLPCDRWNGQQTRIVNAARAAITQRLEKKS